MSELCRRQIIRQQQIMKKSALTVLIALLPLAAIAQTPSINEDGKKIEKEKMETKDYLPEVHGTIRAKYEYQTTMGAGRFDTHVGKQLLEPVHTEGYGLCLYPCSFRSCLHLLRLAQYRQSQD